MASPLQNGSTPSRVTPAVPRPTATPVPRPSPQVATPKPPATNAPAAPKRLVLPARYMRLEPPIPLSAINDDPVFDTGAAGTILGVTDECMKKWRQRDQGPDYIQYGENGPVRYALSTLTAYRAANTVRIRRK